MLLNGVDIRWIQEYLGHTNVETTMIYAYVVKEPRPLHYNWREFTSIAVGCNYAWTR